MSRTAVVVVYATSAMLLLYSAMFIGDECCGAVNCCQGFLVYSSAFPISEKGNDARES